MIINIIDHLASIYINISPYLLLMIIPALIIVSIILLLRRLSK